MHNSSGVGPPPAMAGVCPSDVGLSSVGGWFLKLELVEPSEVGADRVVRSGLKFMAVIK